jgi:hypothetical protein
MATVTVPLMSIDTSGAFADTMVYAKWKYNGPQKLANELR